MCLIEYFNIFIILSPSFRVSRGETYLSYHCRYILQVFSCLVASRSFSICNNSFHRFSFHLECTIPTIYCKFYWYFHVPYYYNRLLQSSHGSAEHVLLLNLFPCSPTALIRFVVKWVAPDPACNFFTFHILIVNYIPCINKTQ